MKFLWNARRETRGHLSLPMLCHLRFAYRLHPGDPVGIIKLLIVFSVVSITQLLNSPSAITATKARTYELFFQLLFLGLLQTAPHKGISISFLIPAFLSISKRPGTCELHNLIITPPHTAVPAGPGFSWWVWLVPSRLFLLGSRMQHWWHVRSQLPAPPAGLWPNLLRDVVPGKHREGFLEALYRDGSLEDWEVLSQLVFRGSWGLETENTTYWEKLWESRGYDWYWEGK